MKYECRNNFEIRMTMPFIGCGTGYRRSKHRSRNVGGMRTVAVWQLRPKKHHSKDLFFATVSSKPPVWRRPDDARGQNRIIY